MKKGYFLLFISIISITSTLWSQEPGQPSPGPQPQPEPMKKAIKQNFALISTEKTLHPTLPKNKEQLLETLETPAEKKLTETIVQNDFDAKTWSIIKSLKPGQFVTMVKGKSGRIYAFKAQRNGSLQITLMK